MPLAMLGLVIFFRASITGASSDGVATLLNHELAECVDRLADRLEVRVHRQRLLEALEGASRLVETKPDHAVPTQRAEVRGIPLEHLVAVRGGLAVLADEVIGGGTLVPPLGEVGLPANHLGKRVDRGVELSMLHFGDARTEQMVHLVVARPAPDVPQRALGQRAHPRVDVAQRGQQGRRIGHRARLRQRRGGATPRLDVSAIDERRQRVFARTGGSRRRRRDEQDDQDEPGTDPSDHGVYASLTAVAAKPGSRPPPGTYTRPPMTAAPMPWRGVGIGVLAIQRLPAGSYISVAEKMRSGASPPKTSTRSASAAAARPPRPRGSGVPVRHASTPAS